jgi:two-component system chemotaxis response regulator CheB
VTPGQKIRVLVVDDSAFARKVLRESLAACSDIEVVGIARDGLDAIEKIAELEPDVITLDLLMPNLDGLGVLRALRADPYAPAVVVVSTADDDSELGVAALVAGAFDLVHKPTALALDRLYELGAELVQKILAAAASGRGPPASRAAPPLLPERPPLVAARTSMVVVGASTGGPHAITALLRALPVGFPVPMAIVVHLPPGYTEAFAKRLDGECALEVVEAREGMALTPGRVVIARAGSHMRVVAEGGGWVAELSSAPADSLHRPSLDALFESAARQVGARTLGVVLTGMGSDGLLGSRAIHAAGGRVLTEAESSSVVYGMPRCVFEAGIAHAEARIEHMAALIMSEL